MKATGILAAAAVAAMFISCDRSPKETIVAGSFSGKSPESFTLSAKEQGKDSTILVQDGEFRLVLPVDVKELYTLTPIAAEGDSTFNAAGTSFVSDGCSYSLSIDPEQNALAISTESAASLTGRLQAMMDTIAAHKAFLSAFNKAVMDTTSLSMGAMDKILMAKDAEIRDIDAEYLIGVLSENKDNSVGKLAFEQLVPKLQDNARIDSIVSVIDTSFINDLSAVRSTKERNTACENSAEGKPFVDFEAVQPDGSTARLSDYAGKGKYVLVDFWASWCPWCLGEIPFLKEAYRKYAGRNFEIVGVDVADTYEKAQAKIKEHGMKWPEIYSKERLNGTHYGSRGIPFIFLVGPDGTILRRDLRGEEIVDVVGAYLDSSSNI